MKNRKDGKQEKISYIFTRETLGMTLMLFCAIVLLMLFTGDLVFRGIGGPICTFMYGTFGYGSILVVVLLGYLGEWLTFEKSIKIPVKRALAISFTVFMLFLLFHAVSTRDYSLESYGTYISDCYMNARYGYAGYTLGGVISALLVYPVAKLGGFVTAYVLFAVLAVFCGYLTFLAFKHKEAPAAKRVKKADEPAAKPVKQPSAEPVRSNAQPVTLSQPVAAAEKPQNDKFSQKNLGRKILFEKGEFDAESYRRNMIFNENSYFNNPAVSSEADYLSSFSANPAAKPAGSKPKSYTESYREEVYNRPVAAMPTSYVYGEKPVENLSPEDDGEGVYAEPAPQPTYTVPEVNQGDEEVKEEDDTYGVVDYGYDAEETDPDYSDGEPESSPEDRTETARRSEDTAIKPAPEDNGGDSLPSVDVEKIFGSSPRGERTERSNAELFDSDDEEDEGTPRPEIFTRNRAEQPLPENARTPLRREPVTPVPVPEPVKEEKVEKPKHVWKKYVRPSLDLLDDYPENANVNTAEIEDNKRIIVETLDRFKIASEVANVTIGPSITRYDVIIEDKTNIKRSLGYRDAIAMELRKDNVNAYLNYSKGALSIEVPNNRRAIVGLKTMLASPKFLNSKPSSLTFALGKNVEGEVVCPDITKMPHLLVAGTTGSGKSICLSALLVSLLYKYGPEELRLILVDPKQVEFISYDKLPHLMINEIIYDCDKAIKALNWAIREMERRYALFKDMSEAGTATKSLDEYNAHLPPEEEKLPKIVIVLDEFGDLMLQAKKDIESRIIKLVQKARACGIHLILATQRPSVDCITGLIKSNLPTRIGFKVNSFDDARTIFDIGGAEKLLGKGDSYFRSAESPDLARIQCCFVDTHEVQKVTDFVKANNETYFDEDAADFINKVEQDEAPATLPGSDGGADDGESKIDDTFIKALKYCVTSNQASVSMIQRRFPVGYIKACKIIDWMENMTYITPSEGSKPRKVLLSKEEFFNIYGEVDD